MSKYTVTTEETGTRAENAVQSVNEMANRGAFYGMKFPSIVYHSGVRCRVEVTDAESPESTQSTTQPDAPEQAEE